MRERLEEINWKLLWAVVSCIVIFIATFAVVLWLRDRDIERVEQLAKSNQQLIQRVDKLNRTQAESAYNECLDRNRRAEVANTELKKLVAAHARDGATSASKFWQDYLNKLKKVKLPPCKKPIDAPS